MGRDGVHVIRDGNRWLILREGDSEAAPAYPNLRDALRIGRSLARKERTELTLYDESGRVRDWADFT